MPWNRWHWLEDGIMPLLVVLMRVCWIWPWLQMLQRLAYAILWAADFFPSGPSLRSSWEVH